MSPVFPYLLCKHDGFYISPSIHPLFLGHLEVSLAMRQYFHRGFEVVHVYETEAATHYFHGYGHTEETNEFWLCPLQIANKPKEGSGKSNTPTMFLFNKTSEGNMVRFADRAPKQIKLIFNSLPTIWPTEQL